MPIWLRVSQWWALAMTEYVVNEIGHQWIVYADRLSVGTCADENSVAFASGLAAVVLWKALEGLVG